MQDIQSQRQELRKLLERMISIPRDNLETSKKYAGDRNTLFSFDQIYNQENTLFSRQAAEIARQLGPKRVSATEYLSIGAALNRAYNIEGAREFLKLAVEHAIDFNDAIAALRTQANMDYGQGYPDAGRANYQRALDIFKTFTTYDPLTQLVTHTFTELQWAHSEAWVGEFSSGLQHIDHAQSLVDAMQNGPIADGWKIQVAEARLQLLQGNAPRPPVPTAPFAAPTEG